MALFNRKPHPETAALEQARATILQKEKELTEAKTARTVMSGELREARDAAARLRGKLEEVQERLLLSEVAGATVQGRLGILEQQNQDLVTTNKKLMDKCFVGMGFTPLWEVRVPNATPSPEPGEAGPAIKPHPNARDLAAEIQRMEDLAFAKDTLAHRQAIIRNMDMDVKEATANGAGK